MYKDPNRICDKIIKHGFGYVTINGKRRHCYISNCLMHVSYQELGKDKYVVLTYDTFIHLLLTGYETMESVANKNIIITKE